MDFSAMFASARPILVAFGLKLLGAIAAYIVGRMLVGFASNLVIRVLERQKGEPTVIRYIGSIISVALNIILVVAGNRAIRETFGSAAYPAAEAHWQVRNTA